MSQNLFPVRARLLTNKSCNLQCISTHVPYRRRENKSLASQSLYRYRLNKAVREGVTAEITLRLWIGRQSWPVSGVSDIFP